MARPKKDPSCPSAEERILVAFWEMLEEMPFSCITIRKISARASVNHNTFYRHFENTYDLANRALESTITPQVARNIAMALKGVDMNIPFDSNSDFSTRFARVVSFARCGSSDLQNTLAIKIKSTWLEAYGIKGSELSEEDALELDILFKLVVTLLGDEAFALTPSLLGSLLDRDLGKGMKLTLMHIIQSYESCGI